MSVIRTRRWRESFLSKPWGVMKKKGRVYDERKKTYYLRAVLLCMAKKKKLIGSLVEIGNLPSTQLFSGVMGRVGENSIKIRPSPGRGCGRLQPPLHW